MSQLQSQAPPPPLQTQSSIRENCNAIWPPPSGATAIAVYNNRREQFSNTTTKSAFSSSSTSSSSAAFSASNSGGSAPQSQSNGSNSFTPTSSVTPSPTPPLVTPTKSTSPLARPEYQRSSSTVALQQIYLKMMPAASSPASTTPTTAPSPARKMSDSFNEMESMQTDALLTWCKKVSSYAIATAIKETQADEHARALEAVQAAIDLMRESPASDHARCQRLIVHLEDMMRRLEVKLPKLRKHLEQHRAQHSSAGKSSQSRRVQL